MRCEICGKKLPGRPVRVKIDGSIMQTCNECSKFGKVQKEPPRPVKPRTPPSRLRSREPSYEVSEDYNTLIRTARERNNWSREELAQKLNEKTSVINRIESSKMIPDIKLARKIERLLKIQILEKIDDEHQEDSVSSTKGGTTIGDIAMIKKR
ncbi:MAG TPA: multiprotein bridging factor aMBF1 [Methanobacterium sp.]|nr:MAG: TIGR00270 family protein [Methanobacterium sp.]HOI71634.1 multiprotein bridging factor aMBF1 [Methanobacterium sp.]